MSSSMRLDTFSALQAAEITKKTIKINLATRSPQGKKALYPYRKKLEKASGVREKTFSREGL
jgi:hypothetical protein